MAHYSYHFRPNLEEGEEEPQPQGPLLAALSQLDNRLLAILRQQEQWQKQQHKQQQQQQQLRQQWQQEQQQQTAGESQQWKV
jgi:hypothetical protein